MDEERYQLHEEIERVNTSQLLPMLILVVVLGAALAYCGFHQEEEGVGADVAELPQTIEGRLAGKTARERANIKAAEIATVRGVPPEHIQFSGAEYRIEVLEITPIERGVEVLARAWDTNGKQIGFGPDGSVDIERFRIINPPVLVADPYGSVVRTSTSRTGETSTFRYREDPREALMQTLAHAIKVKAERSGPEKIVPSRIGRTTSIFYPDANPETTSVDGWCYQSTNNTAWATLRAGTGTGCFDTDTAEIAVGYLTGNVSNFWELYRGVFLFDTSALPDSDTISSVTLSLFGTEKVAANGANIEIYFSSSSPASNTALATGDYDGMGFGGANMSATTISYASFSTTTYNDYTLNASGVANVTKTGVSKFAAISQYDNSGTTPPRTGASRRDHIKVNYADQTGTTNDPKLVVEHSGSAAPAVSSDVMILEQ